MNKKFIIIILLILIVILAGVSLTKSKKGIPASDNEVNNQNLSDQIPLSENVSQSEGMVSPEVNVNYSNSGFDPVEITVKVGETVTSGFHVEAKLGNALPLGHMPVGTIVHNIELTPGQGGILARGAGAGATILAKEGDYVTIKLPSGETRLVFKDNFASVGTLGNVDWKNIVIGKAGRSRHMGHRPEVRGTAQNPRTHPHGGGEGRSGEGLKSAKTPWGKIARGLRTRKKGKHSDKYIVERRKK